jgi:butyrate response factor 1
MVQNRGRTMSSPGPLYGTKFNTARYKTEMCQRYEETGECKFFDKCQFAHGQMELRNISKHPKFKTTPCKTFHTTGVCSYGNRCNFLHSEKPDELDIMKMKHAAARRMSVPAIMPMVS